VDQVKRSRLQIS